MDIYVNKCSYLGISCLNTPFSMGKNHILDGSATAGQLEVPTLTHQLELLSHLCNKVIMLKKEKMHLEVYSSYEIKWAGLTTCWCNVMHIYIVMLYIAVHIVVSGK